ncbi:LLM class flavin-dependent oxidoreductase [Novosphingobium sp. SG720]|uniref:LLM class flavin-dependent oxidoreductase n=1 Tax=Novosphingobium sp. SG720 TaxID=2586998 RepID=UPI0014477AE5|nr:LLM class flavin-dependent oxidoreductase [Novosphingobium sp. SG720]NKJ40644.1 alkanesulfonate monooxygenase SsuD/methylene tetrahydromethanopterin reductase-like flavin-dependent oxidoreductase (luciferase family) [Novosphingobium sp. SG720]
MKIGMFQTPFLRPERTAKQVFQWAVRQAIHADRVGFSEYWVGEHGTLDWESIPSPELVIAAAGAQTSQIKFGPLAHLLPYHHPASLAIQTAWLSQVLEGRYMLGVATGAYPTDAAVRGITDMSKNHAMMLEAIDIMERVWKNEPFQMEGQFWNAGYPTSDPAHPLRDTRPWGGEMQMAMTGLSAPSPSIAFAGRHGFLPASVYAGNAFLRSHFETYREEMERAGRPSDRSAHRVVRDVVVAETDAEARKLALDGGLGLAWESYIKPTYKRFGVLKGLLHDPSVDPDTVDAEYLAEHVWIVGSVETVRQKIQAWCDDLGGPFGTLLVYSHDYIDNPEPWEHSMTLLAQEVAPQIGAPTVAIVA